jgi:hypothetical protein
MFARRYFTSGFDSPLNSLSFTKRFVDDGQGPVRSFDVPDDWSREAVSAFAPALRQNVPVKRLSVEENTLPSWLWKHRAGSAEQTSETSARQVFDRVAGAATYAGWKRGLWHDEVGARVFYEEITVMLAKRIVAIESESLSVMVTAWAYETPATTGNRQCPVLAETVEIPTTIQPKMAFLALRNENIDSILSNDHPLAISRWEKFLRSGKSSKSQTLAFVDSGAEWCPVMGDELAPRAMLDLLQFRRDDGTMDLAALRHAAALTLLLLDLHDESLPTSGNPARPLAIGFANLGTLLMSLGLPYDSSEGRSTAAALSAIMTAETIAASARLAESFGPCLGFLARREESLRALRNHRRAAYGERNDFERLSILPVPLMVEDGADLVLVAAARRAWDSAYELAHKHGLRHLQTTALFEAPFFALFLESSAQGLDPETQVVRSYAAPSEDEESFRRVIHAAAYQALENTSNGKDLTDILDYALGHGTLKNAPGINHGRLSGLGFDADAFARVESYLPKVNDIRTAFTPWVLGEAFCRHQLKISPRNLLDPRFDMLRHLGFSDEDIEAANVFCCGHGTFFGAEGLSDKAANVFAPTNASAEARIGMAAAVQSFIMGDVNLVLSLPIQTSSETRAGLYLSGWRQGLRSMRLYFEGFTLSAQFGLRTTAVRLQRKIIGRQQPVIPMPVLPLAARNRTASRMTSPRAAKPKATARAASLRRQPDSGHGKRGSHER